MPPSGRADDQSGVGDPSGDHDVRAGLQRRHDPACAEVGVGAQRVTGEGLPRVEVGPLPADLGEARQQVVTTDRGDLRPRAEFTDRLSRGHRVEATGIADHLDALLQAGGKDLFHLLVEGSGVPGAMLHLLAGQQEHGQLREPITGQDVDRTALDHLLCGGEAVPEEP